MRGVFCWREMVGGGGGPRWLVVEEQQTWLSLRGTKMLQKDCDEKFCGLYSLLTAELFRSYPRYQSLNSLQLQRCIRNLEELENDGDSRRQRFLTWTSFICGVSEMVSSVFVVFVVLWSCGNGRL